MLTPEYLIKAALIGCGATIVMDAWLILLRRMGIPTLDFALLGRWVGHMFRGRLRHAAIAKAPPIPAERLLGWCAHYAIGIVFALMLAAAAGASWIDRPSVKPALAFGILSVGAPLFVLQPAMGAGFAASRTPTPLKNCLRSLANHTVFGLGLYLSALVLAQLAP